MSTDVDKREEFSEEEVEASMDETAKRLFRISIKDPDHLKRWLKETRRDFLIFDAVELVDALPFPSGHNVLMQIVAAYRDHRMAVPSGRTETQKNFKGEDIRVEIMKTDVLEDWEIDRLIRFLIGEITEKNPGWKLENPPLR